MPKTTSVFAFALPLLLCLAGCGGGGNDVGGGGGVSAPENLSYATMIAVYDTEMAVPANSPSWEGGAPQGFSVSPDLPDGMTLDPASGVISGTTTKLMAARRLYRVTASNAGGSATADLEFTVGVLDSLADGHQAELIADGLATPVRLALLPDGRILFNELGTGQTRVLRTNGTVQATPFAQTDVITGGHRGLLGLVLHPGFATNGWVYVSACIPGVGILEDRQVVRRYTAAETSPGILEGTSETLIVDDLPVAAINNGGDLAFDHSTPTPRLFVSMGDSDEETNAQEVGGLAGRVLRVTESGSIPADNPSASDATWCLGLRNTFCIAVQPNTGDLWGSDNGPASDDKLHFLNKGRNFGWGGLPPGTPPSDVGIVVTNWIDVIVPTGLAWHGGQGWGATYANDLFQTSYADEAIRRFRLSGVAFLDVDEEIVFAEFRPDGIDNKPLDIEIDPTTGDLYLSTFTAIYRIRRIP